MPEFTSSTFTAERRRRKALGTTNGREQTAKAREASINARKGKPSPLRGKPGKSPGRPRKYIYPPTAVENPNPEQKRAVIRDIVSQYSHMRLAKLRDIGSFPREIEWGRRLECKESLQHFCKTYLADIFDMPWSSDQLKCVEKAEKVCRDGGKFTVAMPRAGGKTAIVRAATLWASIYGYKRFIYNIGSKEEFGKATLRMVQVHLNNNPLLHKDFPELCWAIIALGDANYLSKKQLFYGTPTFPNWEQDNIRYPILLLTPEFVDYYGGHDPTSLRHIKHLDRHITTNAGCILRSAGIDGSIRGEAEADPITLEQPRPDLVILDDVQKDQKADSPVLCEKLVRLIDGAITGLSGKGRHIDCLMPCTVIREDDVADTFLNPLIKPDWEGERCQMVKSWPPGLTDYEITNDTEHGKLWNAYAELRRVTLRDKGRPKSPDNAFTNFYKAHQKVMDFGFEVSWKERFDNRTEISANQHAMNLRLSLGPSFLPEYQNIGRKLINAGEIYITAKQLAEKTVNYERGVVPTNCQFVVSHLDIQNEIIFYCSLAVDHDFNGTFIDYGTWPEIAIPYFTKTQCETWSLVTEQFFKAYPEHKNKAIKSTSGRHRAPFEAKIYFAVGRAIEHLLAKKYVRAGEHKKTLPISHISIDTRWGQASEVIKRYIRESHHQKMLMPYYGQAFEPTKRQLEEYERREGWWFENMQHPNIREPKWVLRPNPDGMWYMAADVNRLKDFLFARLGTPLGAPGSVSLFKAPAETHELFVHHLCNSEYPEPVSARHITKNQWTPREGIAFDNDWLDCAAGCMALGSIVGASIKTADDSMYKPITRKLSAIRDQKQKQRTADRGDRSQSSRLVVEK